jgi:hypothetical protein
MACMNDADCNTNLCSDGVCSTLPDVSTCEPSDAGATCSDCLMNGLETDTDCGGDSCDPCVIGQKCSSDYDCIKGSRCSNLICSPS